MASLNLILFAILQFTLVFSVPLPAPFTEHCIVGEKNLYPPTGRSVPTYVINLDLPPAQRWTEVATTYAAGINDLIQVIKNLSYPLVGDKLVNWIDNNMGTWNAKLPQPFQDELAGIAEAAKLNLGEIVLYNIFYEVFTVCTSIVAEDPSGKLWHARNLDFGLFLGWDPKTHEWEVTAKLRKIIINLEWQRGGKTLFKSVNFAGYIGVYNGLKQNMFTVTANERFDVDGGYVGIIQWLTGKSDDSWMTWLTRAVMENATSYTEAQTMLSNTTLMSPVYFILGGTQSGEGSIITRAREKTLNVKSLDTSQPNGWYVLETNYDNWKPPLFIDDRRTPGNECMQKLGRNGVGFQGLFNVLSSQTTLNMLTTYTVLMQVDSGQFETYIQQCQQPCWFA